MKNSRISLFFFFSFLICLILLPGKSISGTKAGFAEKPEDLMNKTFLALYHNDFKKADSLSGRMQLINDGGYLGHFARANYLWWMILTHPRNEDLEGEYSRTIKKAINSLGSTQDQDLNDIFYHINIYAIEARLSLHKKQYVQAVRNLRACFRQIEFSMGKEDLHQGFYLTSGLYNYLSGYAISRVPMLRLFPGIIPPGEMQLGIEQLQKASDSANPVWRTEANYLLMKIFLEMEKQPLEALIYINRLIDWYPENLVYHRYLFMIYKAMQDTDAMHSSKIRIAEIASDHQGLSSVQIQYFLDFANR